MLVIGSLTGWVLFETPSQEGGRKTVDTSTPHEGVVGDDSCLCLGAATEGSGRSYCSGFLRSWPSVNSSR